MTLSEQHYQLSWEDKIKYEEDRLKIIGEKLKLSPINHQEIGTKIDFSDSDGNLYQLETPFKMLETGNFFLAVKKWEKCKDICKYWIVCKPKDLIEYSKLWLLEVKKIEDWINEYQPMKLLSKDGFGYLISEKELDKISSRIYEK